MSEISLRMADGTRIVVPASLDAITTYVILEQEKWFEKETALLARWLRPGMNMMDIGANLGVYSLPAARLVGPTGQVFSYEPASETSRLLAMSKTENGLDNLHIIAAALSDGEREGHLVLGASSELNSLDGSGPGERVRITSLDAEEKVRNWGSIDFIKIDAEGEEDRILAGAKSFFANQSPLVMFEMKAGAKLNENLPAAFIAMGYRIYRLLAGAPVLVPVVAGEPLDLYELNLFAAKPNRASALMRDGVLVESIPEWKPNGDAHAKALVFFRTQAFAPICAQFPGGDIAIEPVYRDALAGYAMWRTDYLSLPERCGALRYACDTLAKLCEQKASLPRVSTLARMSWEMGRRGVSVHLLKVIMGVLKQGTGRIMEPFWPASPRFDSIAPSQNITEWYVAAAMEQLEQTAFFTSKFGNSGADLDWLSNQPSASTEVERRRILVRLRDGQKIEASPRVMTPAADNLNAEIWRSGRVTGMIGTR